MIELKKCKMCDSSINKIVYRPMRYYGFGMTPLEYPEHLEVTCAQCGYKWEEKTMSHRKEKKP